jgi:hypothetical protein
VGLSAHSKVYGRVGCYACFFGFIHECRRFNSATTGAPHSTYSTMASQVAATKSRLKAPVVVVVELQPVQQSPSKCKDF